VHGERLPLSIDGRKLTGGHAAVDSSISSQFLSGLLLSAPLFDGPTTIEVTGELVSQPYVDLTVSTMADFGVDVQIAEPPAISGAGGRRFTVDGTYRGAELRIEPDASAASYFFAAAAVTGGRVRIDGLGTDTVQGDIRFVELLAAMGADVDQGPDWTEVRGTGRLRGITADMADISDTAQTLAVVAAFAESPTEITNIGFIRFKETDRIAAAVTELQRRGIDAAETDDGMIIRPGSPKPGRVETYDDHRMAMSFALLGLRHPGIEIGDPGCVSKTFPDFFAVLDKLRSP
jgi:3-phosphoshikimate 1-carboxyvinyltransferase